MTDVKVDHAVLDLTLDSPAVSEYAQHIVMPLVKQLLQAYSLPVELQGNEFLASDASSLELDLGDLPYDEAQLKPILRERLYSQLDDKLTQALRGLSAAPSATADEISLIGNIPVLHKHQGNTLLLMQLQTLQTCEFASANWCNALTALARACEQTPLPCAPIKAWLVQAKQATQQALSAKRNDKAKLQQLMRVVAQRLDFAYLNIGQFIEQLVAKLTQLADYLPASHQRLLSTWCAELSRNKALDYATALNMCTRLHLLLSIDNTANQVHVGTLNPHAQLRKELKPGLRLLRDVLRAQYNVQPQSAKHSKACDQPEYFSLAIKRLLRQLRKELSVLSRQYRDLSEAQSLLTANQPRAAHALIIKHGANFKWLQQASLPAVQSATTNGALTSALNFLNEQKEALNQQLSSVLQLKLEWLTYSERPEQAAYWQQLKLDKQLLQRLKRAFQHTVDSSKQTQQVKAQLQKLTAKAQAQLATPNQRDSLPCSAGGLILLWPLLNACFAELGWLNLTQSQFVDEQAQHQAMHLLAYLAGEQAQIPLTAALLVGLGVEHIDQPSVQPSEQAQQAGERLLEGLLHHWQGFNTRSTATLTDLFIRRECVIEPYANGHRLTVHKQPQDALLQSLPFGIATIKLPWSEQLIYGHWS